MLSKSDFQAFRHCPKCFWLKAHKSDAIVWPAPSAFDRMLMKDGYAVEAEMKRLIATRPDRDRFSAQQVFQTADLFARADFVRRNEDDAIDIFEVKASTAVKTSGPGDHVNDVAFQTYVARQCGLNVHSTHIVHVDSGYVLSGDIDPAALLTFVDVTDKVEERLAALGEEISEALALLDRAAIDEDGCSCLLFGSPDNRCAAFAHFNPDVPEQSIYLLPRISSKKVAKFLEERRLLLKDVDPSELSAGQIPVHQAGVSGEPVIDRPSIREFIDALHWPLHFYDYETFASAVPHADGHEPYQAMPVQYSLHVLHETGELEHFEFLAERHGEQRALVEHMRETFRPAGSVISWNKGYENGCNRRMARLLPDHAEFLEAVTKRTLDLRDPFEHHLYVDIRFRGSTSIKKILPVLCPELAYPKDEVHDGAGAMEAWLQMVETDDERERARLRAELLHYCGLDTEAMVAIYRVLTSLPAR